MEGEGDRGQETWTASPCSLPPSQGSMHSSIAHVGLRACRVSPLPGEQPHRTVLLSLYHAPRPAVPWRPPAHPDEPWPFHWWEEEVLRANQPAISAWLKCSYAEQPPCSQWAQLRQQSSIWPQDSALLSPPHRSFLLFAGLLVWSREV